MNWDDLRFLVEIGRSATLAAAARHLKVDQTTVARRLRALEDALGTPLFERSDGHWRPTGVGADVLERAMRIEEDVAGLARLAEAGAQAVSGVVRLTAVGAIVGDYLVPRLPGLYARHPELVVELIASNDNLNVSRREADIAIRLARPESGDFLIRKLADVGFAVYGPAQPGPTRSNDWVTYDDELAHTPEMRWLAPRLAGGRLRLRSNSLDGLARAVAVDITVMDYVEAARLRGEGTGWIIFREILPNALSPLVAELGLRFIFAVLFISTLSFLGLGVQPPLPEWGAMVSAGRSFLVDQWWIPTLPGIAIFIVSLGFNLLGDGLRDVLDPKSAK